MGTKLHEVTMELPGVMPSLICSDCWSRMKRHHVSPVPLSKNHKFHIHNDRMNCYGLRFHCSISTLADLKPLHGRQNERRCALNEVDLLVCHVMKVICMLFKLYFINLTTTFFARKNVLLQ